MYRQFVDIPKGKTYAPLVAGLFLICFERYFVLSFSVNDQGDVIKAINSTKNINVRTNDKSDIAHRTL